MAPGLSDRRCQNFRVPSPVRISTWRDQGLQFTSIDFTAVVENSETAIDGQQRCMAGQRIRRAASTLENGSRLQRLDPCANAARGDCGRGFVVAPLAYPVGSLKRVSRPGIGCYLAEGICKRFVNGLGWHEPVVHCGCCNFSQTINSDCACELQPALAAGN